MFASYEEFVDFILRLQNCYRLSKLIEKNLVEKIELLTRVRAGIAIAVALWCFRGFKQRMLDYSDIVYVQRRLANFISKLDPVERKLVEVVTMLSPQSLGLDIATTASRCMVSPSQLIALVQSSKILRECLELALSAPRIDEPLRHDKRLCLSDHLLLPPAHAAVDLYMKMIIDALMSSDLVARDPMMNHVVEVINDKFIRNAMNPNDVVASSLIVLVISKRLGQRAICADPCIDIEAIAKRLYSDLTSLGADPQRSEIFEIYSQLQMRSALL